MNSSSLIGAHLQFSSVGIGRYHTYDKSFPKHAKYIVFSNVFTQGLYFTRSYPTK